MTGQKQYHHAHLYEVQALLASGALANACDEEGVSPLLACIEASPNFRLESTTDASVPASHIVDGKQAIVQVSGTVLASDFRILCTHTHLTSCHTQQLSLQVCDAVGVSIA